MNCKTVSGHLSAYLDRELSGDLMLSIREHLHSCPQCQQELEGLKEVKSFLGNMDAVQADEALAREIKSQVIPREIQRKKRNWKGIATVTATLLVASCFAMLVYLETGSGQEELVPLQLSPSQTATDQQEQTPHVPIHLVSSD